MLVTSAGDKAKPASDSYIAGYQDGFSGLAPAKSFPADQSGFMILLAMSVSGCMIVYVNAATN